MEPVETVVPLVLPSLPVVGHEFSYRVDVRDFESDAVERFSGSAAFEVVGSVARVRLVVRQATGELGDTVAQTLYHVALRDARVVTFAEKRRAVVAADGLS